MLPSFSSSFSWFNTRLAKFDDGILQLAPDFVEENLLPDQRINLHPLPLSYILDPSGRAHGLSQQPSSFTFTMMLLQTLIQGCGSRGEATAIA